MSIDTLEIELVDAPYSWANLTLLQFLQDGNYPSKWLPFFHSPIIETELKTISDHLEKESKKYIIYPPINWVFRAFYTLDLTKIKVVLLGQDCYHTGSNEFDGSAVGYAFSVRKGNQINPSLRNIYTELNNEGFRPVKDGDLTYLVNQGVFLINTALSVRQGNALSHAHFWFKFSTELIKYISQNMDNLVWLLFGSAAQSFSEFIGKNHIILETSHPSPFSAYNSTRKCKAFMKSNVFKEANSYLINPILW